ncbi:hypothetical protein EP51_28385 [Rhodococcus opacus]|uniref:Uncharacterized protein n=1 Tax=Rhodococcus opacus TaxID=37919 RepID=A0A076ESV2_RHOOP|nr:hypothetical protein EP51_28385 [Rhodococcus opacus]
MASPDRYVRTNAGFHDFLEGVVASDSMAHTELALPVLASPDVTLVQSDCTGVTSGELSAEAADQRARSDR